METFLSVLDERQPELPASGPPACFKDLNLDQVVDTLTDGLGDYDLLPLFHRPARTIEAVLYRQEVARDVDAAQVSAGIDSFSRAMRDVRRRMEVSEKSYHWSQKQRWFLQAAETYESAVRKLHEDLLAAPLRSRGVSGFRDYLAAYLRSDRFQALQRAMRHLVEGLDAVRYTVLVRSNGVTVRRYEDEADYNIQVDDTFEKFRTDDARDYRTEVPVAAGMNSVEERIAEGVAALYPELFAVLARFPVEWRDYLDPAVARFDREIQFYRCYFQAIGRLRSQGLRFCYPVLSDSKDRLWSSAGFDLALAFTLAGRAERVVENDFRLDGGERILLVSGPNQGGKTTFARSFGQLHHLGALGLPVPGDSAQLFLCDQIFTHFEMEEDMRNLHGKLQDDLMRIRRILEQATSRSVIIMNEIFNSTTLSDAEFLAEKVVRRIREKDIVSVCVTFLDELVSVDEAIVGMASTVVAEDPARRTFKVVRMALDGRSYAVSIAEKYRLTYDDLTRRLGARRTEEGRS